MSAHPTATREAAESSQQPPEGSVPNGNNAPEVTLRIVLLLAAVSSSGTSLMITGIYFFTAHRYGWGLLQNFLLAAGQGTVYIVGALNSHRITQRFKPRRVLAAVYGAMAAIALAAWFVNSVVAVTILLLLYTIVSVISWPILESQVTVGADSGLMSRRVSIYNLVWAAVSVVMLAVDGAIIQHWPAGMFLWPFAAHGVAMFIVLLAPKVKVAAHSATPDAAPSTLNHELLRSRTLALWLSRLALPATYVVIYGLMALMPSLPVMSRLDTTHQTLLGSIWMASRWVAFLLLGVTTWWHTRPRLLVAAAIAMLIAYVVVTIRPSDLFPSASFATDILAMSCGQVLLGACMGVVYSCSLYFGMVLSEGSTEHGGYHEALIGLGQVLGPGVGAAAALVRPGSVNAGVGAVGVVIFISTAAVVVASIVGARKGRLAERIA